MDPDLNPMAIGDAAVNPLAARSFRLIEHMLLIIIALMTLGAASFEVWAVIGARNINLADILLMFLYTEVIGMVSVFYVGRGSPFVYPIFIAITALARLIVRLARTAFRQPGYVLRVVQA